MSNSMINALNSRLRMSGMASGLDTDSMVQKLLQVERIKVDKVKQQRQIMEWKRDDYRSTITSLKRFQDDFFDFLSAKTNMRSVSAYKKFTVSSTNSDIVRAVAGPTAAPGEHKLEVRSLAESASRSSSNGISKDIEASNAINFDLLNGREFVLDIDGTRSTIQLSGFSELDTTADKTVHLQNIINSKIGSGKVKVELNPENKLVLSVIDNRISKVTITHSDALARTALFGLGFDANSNYSNRLDVDRSLAYLAQNTNTPFSLKPEVVGIRSAGSALRDYSEMGARFNISIDGNEKVIALEGEYTNYSDLKAEIESKIKAAFSVDYPDIETTLNVSFDARGALTIGLADHSKKMSINAPYEGYNVLNDLGLRPSEGLVNININGKEFKFDSNTTLREMMHRISADSAAEVNMQYDEISDTIKIIADRAGSFDSVGIDETGSTFFQSLGLTKPENHISGKDGVFIYNGNTIMRSSNTFNIGGVSFTALKEGAEQRINVSRDVDGIFDNIKGFVERYNQMMETLNSKLYEDRSKKYQPLTDDQRQAMSEKDVEKWEEKAKAGLLKGDSILSSITGKFRSAAYEIIQGIGVSASQFGITTIKGSEGVPKDRGKLTIDENKLKAAIISNPDLVSEVFIKESSVGYSPDLTEEQRSLRYKESGIIHRMYDILQDNIRTIRNAKGLKGVLLEKAGMVGDITEFKNLMIKDIDKQSTLIDTLNIKLYDKENALYKKFAAMEKALSSMNSQSSWLAQQFGGGR